MHLPEAAILFIVCCSQACVGYLFVWCNAIQLSFVVQTGPVFNALTSISTGMRSASFVDCRVQLPFLEISILRITIILPAVWYARESSCLDKNTEDVWKHSIEKLRSLYSAPNITRAIKPTTMGQKDIQPAKVILEILKKTVHSKDMGVEEIVSKVVNYWINLPEDRCHW